MTAISMLVDVLRGKSFPWGRWTPLHYAAVMVFVGLVTIFAGVATWKIAVLYHRVAQIEQRLN